MGSISGMSKIRLSNDVSVSLSAGERLLDALDELWLATPTEPVLRFDCRAANCGSCRVRVRVGAAALSDADSAERATLLQLGAADDERLACQVRLRSGAPEIEIVLEPSAPAR
jgi:ferredoxin